MGSSVDETANRALCLGNSLLSAKRRQTEQEDGEKGMLEYAEENTASGNITELES